MPQSILNSRRQSRTISTAAEEQVLHGFYNDSHGLGTPVLQFTEHQPLDLGLLSSFISKHNR